jgi:hypothetical protein
MLCDFLHGRKKGTLGRKEGISISSFSMKNLSEPCDWKR